MSECVSKNKDAVIVLKENKSKAVFLNPQRDEVLQVLVDGCEISDDRERCDYLVLYDETGWYVELKGSDVEKALKQIQSTILILRKKYPARSIRGVVVSSRVPAISGFQKAATKLTRNKALNVCDVLLKCRKVEISLN